MRARATPALHPCAKATRSRPLRSCLTSMRRPGAGRMVFTVFEVTYKNQDGEKVAAIRQSMVRQQ